MEEYCVCGHPKITHWWQASCRHTETSFNKDGHKGLWYCICCGFKLDNLRFIEDTAKAQGLI